MFKNVIISSGYYEFSGGGGIVDTRFRHHCRLKAHFVISYKTTFRKLSFRGEGRGGDKSI